MSKKKKRTKKEKKRFLAIFLLHFSLIDLSKAGPVFFSNEEKYLGKTVCTCKKSAKRGGRGGNGAAGVYFPAPHWFSFSRPLVNGKNG